MKGTQGSTAVLLLSVYRYGGPRGVQGSPGEQRGTKGNKGEQRGTKGNKGEPWVTKGNPVLAVG